MSAESIEPLMRLPFQEGEEGENPISALQLQLREIPFTEAVLYNQLWHSRLPRLGTGFIKNMPFLSYAAEYANRVYAVAIWSNPVARLLPQKEWLELRRLAVSPEAPKNTASRMLGVMKKLICKSKPEVTTLVSYQDTVVHRGTIYAAAGWEKTSMWSGGEWNRPNSKNLNGTPRTRPKAQSSSPKQRWELKIR